MEFLLAIVSGTIIGLVLGVLGGGGALMAIPILLYLLHYPFRAAIGTSLLLVALGALPALLLYVRGKVIDFGAGIKMGLGGAIGATLGSSMSHWFEQDSLVWLLIGLMAISAWNMLKPGKSAEVSVEPSGPFQSWGLLLGGLGVGILTGLVGVGGGFLLVPVLLFFGNCSPRTAIATSLGIIAINAVFGTFGYRHLLPLNQPTFWVMVISTLLGSVIGFALSKRLSEQALKKGFGLLLILLMGLLILMPPAS